MSKIKVIKILSLMSILLLTSCWDRVELSSVSLVEGMGIDIVDGQYEVSLVIVSNLEASDQQRGDAPIEVYSGKGDTPIEAFANIYPKLGTYIYYKHVQYLVLSERVAENYIEETIEEIVRGDVRYNTHIFIVKDYMAKEVVSILPSNYTFTTINLEIMSDNAAKYKASSYYATILDVHRDMMLKGQDLVIPMIKIHGDDIEKGFSIDNNSTTQRDIRIEVNEVGIFNNNKLVASTDDDEAMGLGLLESVMLSPAISFINENDCKISVKVTGGNNKKSAIVIDNNVEALITVDLIGDLVGFTCDEELTEPQMVDKLEAFLENEFEKLMQKGIQKTQSVGSDILGIGEIVRRKDKEYWLENEDNWNDVYKTIPISINVKFTLEDIGVFTKVFKKE